MVRRKHLRHGGCRRAIVKTCALRLAGKSHEHDIDNAAGQRNQRTNDRRAKTAGGHAAITIVITAKLLNPPYSAAPPPIIMMIRPITIAI